MKAQCLLILCFLLAANGKNIHKPKAAPSCGYDSCPVAKPGFTNVHIIAHTHLDVGWLKNPDELYYGSKSYIQRAGVQYILDSVVGALLKDPARRFIQVETAFFWQWWENQSESTRNAVKDLVQSGRLEFIGGGWCMNDEGAAHYNAIVDQMTVGLRRLSGLFGECGVPKVAWQIDPFGHSREQASLFAQMGFDGLFLGRIDYQDKNLRLQTKTMEMVWNASANLGDKAHLFTGVLYNTYSPPSGFCFDLLCNDEPIIDNPKSRDYNADRRVDDFITAMLDESRHYATNNIPVTMGNDFNYQQADSWFINLDRLIKYTNARQADGSKLNVFYSTPSCYLNSLNKAKKSWPTKSDDFMPYASDPHSFWTGYYTSRPALKGYVRQNNAFLQVCKQLDFLTGYSDPTNRLEKVEVLKESMAVAQHHDAVSGTAKQQVTNDYMERLYNGAENCRSVVDDVYQILLPLGKTTPPHQSFCHQLNVSQCHITEYNDDFTVTVYNPLGHQVNTPVRFPATKTNFVITGPNIESIDYKIVPVPRGIIDLAERDSVATWEVVFMATVDALGFATYFVDVAKDNKGGNDVIEVKRHLKRQTPAPDVTIQNKNVKVVVDGSTGLLKKVVNIKEMISLPVKQNFLWYRGMDGYNSRAEDRASGAYIFRPNGSAEEVSPICSTRTFKSDLVQEIHQQFSDWVSQVIRLYADSDHVEFDWIVGPIPVNDRIGREVITRFDAPSLASSGVFYTDSNGREVLQRVKDHRPTWNLNLSEPIAGNYYPVNSLIFTRDTKQEIQMTLLTDRSVGGSSLMDGSLELMVHRRLLEDDAFGVGEALNEPGTDGKGLVVRGKTHLHVGGISTAAAAHRVKAMQLLMTPHLSFSTSKAMQPDEYKNNFRTSYSALKTQLPPNVHFLTLERVAPGEAIIRFEHFFEKNEDPKLSQPAIVDLPNLFFNHTITSMQEMTLAANQQLSNDKRLQWDLDTNEIRDFKNKRETEDSSLSGAPTTIQLEPMQIRTFIIKYEKSAETK